MTPLEIKTPPGASISNYLYPVMDAEDLTQDLVTVSLPNGNFIDVGWYPEHDPMGRFVVRVFAGFWDRQMIDPPIETPDVDALISVVEDLADRFARKQVPSTRSGETRLNLVLS